MQNKYNRLLIGVADITCLAEAAVYEKAWAVSSPQRRRKAERLRQPADKQRCIGAGLLLNRMLAKACDPLESQMRTSELEGGLLNINLTKAYAQYQPAYDYEIDFCENGKPYFTAHPELYFNLSHAGCYVVCAIAGAPVGVDIEGGRSCSGKVAARFFSRDENAWIMAGESEERFFRLWTLKEAFVKTTGIGISKGMHLAHFQPANRQPGGENGEMAFVEPALAREYMVRSYRHQGYSIAAVIKKRAFLLRKYRPEDCRAMADLFYDTVHTVNARDYKEEQLAVWADGSTDLKAWHESFMAHETVVAVQGDRIVGFGDLAQDGYLDRLYVHKDFQGCRIASAICDWLEMRCGGNRIITHASVTARHFFEQRGYKLVTSQQVERKGILLVNYVMQLDK